MISKVFSNLNSSVTKAGMVSVQMPRYTDLGTGGLSFQTKIETITELYCSSSPWEEGSKEVIPLTLSVLL